MILKIELPGLQGTKVSLIFRVWPTGTSRPTGKFAFKDRDTGTSRMILMIELPGLQGQQVILILRIGLSGL